MKKTHKIQINANKSTHRETKKSDSRSNYDLKRGVTVNEHETELRLKTIHSVQKIIGRIQGETNVIALISEMY